MSLMRPGHSRAKREKKREVECTQDQISTTHPCDRASTQQCCSWRAARDLDEELPAAPVTRARTRRFGGGRGELLRSSRCTVCRVLRTAACSVESAAVSRSPASRSQSSTEKPKSSQCDQTRGRRGCPRSAEPMTTRLRTRRSPAIRSDSRRRWRRTCELPCQPGRTLVRTNPSNLSSSPRESYLLRREERVGGIRKDVHLFSGRFRKGWQILGRPIGREAASPSARRAW